MSNPRPKRRPTYEHTYQPFILEKIDIVGSKRDLKIGQVIEFMYDGSLNNPQFVWVLNPFYEFQLHGLSLKDIPWHRFKLLMKKIASDDDQLILERLNDVALPVDTLIESNELFYQKTLKPHVAVRKHEPYRRFLPGKMKRIKLVMLDLRDIVQYPERFISPSGNIYEADQKV